MVSIGGLSLTLGIIGIAIPILPTTPFIILAAACFSASSPKIYNKLINNKFFGEYIRHYREKTGVRASVKVYTLLFLYATLIVSGILINNLISTIIFSVVGVLVTIHIIMIKTRKKDGHW